MITRLSCLLLCPQGLEESPDHGRHLSICVCGMNDYRLGLFESTCLCLDSQEVEPETEILQQVIHGRMAWGETREG